MKVIILGTAWPYRGGIAAFSERLAHELQHEGHQVELVTFTLQYPAFLFPGKTQYSTSEAPKDLTIRRMLNSINPFSWIRTARYIRRQRPDLLITPFWLPFMSPSLGTVCRLARCRAGFRLSIVHNLIPHEHHPGDRLLARYFVGANDGFVTLSQSVLTDIDRFDPQQRRPRCFSPHPLYDHFGPIVDKATARQNLAIDSQRKLVLFFGFIRDYKGLDLLLEAMGDRRLAEMDVHLLVAGEVYGDVTPYNDQIQRLGIGSRVTMHTDFIADDAVADYFCAADIVAQPYKSATQSGVTQIAFHFERPMLVTAVGGLAETVPDGQAGLVVQPDAQQIADALVRYFSEQLEQRFTEGVRVEKEKYSWHRLTEAIAALIQHR